MTKAIIVGHFSVAKSLIFGINPHAHVVSCDSFVFGGLGDPLGFFKWSVTMDTDYKLGS